MRRNNDQVTCIQAGFVDKIQVIKYVAVKVDKRNIQYQSRKNVEKE